MPTHKGNQSEAVQNARLIRRPRTGRDSESLVSGCGLVGRLRSRVNQLCRRLTNHQPLIRLKKTTHSRLTRTRPRSIHLASRMAMAGSKANRSPNAKTIHPKGGR